MSVPVRVTPAARDDIRYGERYFEGRRAGLGVEFVEEVLAILGRIGDMPLGYGELGDGVRAVGLRRFGYVVYYRSDGTAAEVVAVLHGGRSPEAWQARA
jgi:toxin ParE1/3/4